MPLATNGGFDQVVEIEQTLLTLIAREGFSPQTGTLQLEQEGFRGTADYGVALHSLWLGMRNERWLPARLDAADRVVSSARWLPDNGADERPQVELATITLDIHVTIAITEVRLDTSGWTAVPPDRFQVEFDGYVDVTASLDAVQLTVRTDRDRPQLTEFVWCAVIRLHGINFPQISVVIDEYRISRALPILLSNVQAFVAGGNLAVAANLQSVYTQIRQSIGGAVRQSLGAATDWRHDGGGLLLLYDTAGMVPSATALGVRSLKGVAGAQPISSLFVGVQTRGVGGAAVFATSSQLDAGETMCITIPHAAFLRDALLPAIEVTFPGIRIADLDVPLLRRWLIATRAPVEVSGADPFTLEQLLVYIDDAELIHITFAMRAERYGGAVTAHATIDLQLGIRARVVPGVATQVLEVTPTILNKGNAVLTKRADVAWWVYLLAGGLGGLTGGASVGMTLGVIVAAVLDGIVAENTFQGQLRDQIAASSPGPSTNSVPSDVDLTVTDVSLRQQGSQRLAGGSWNFFEVWDHDLVIHLASKRLPDRLAVVCQVPDSADPGFRIDAVGVVPATSTRRPTGRVRRLPIDSVIAMIDAGTHTFVARSYPPDDPVDPRARREPPVDSPITVVHANPPYLRTTGERPPDASNNLGQLPRCS